MKFKFNLFTNKNNNNYEPDSSFIKLNVWLDKNDLPKEVEKEIDFDNTVINEAIKSAINAIQYDLRTMITEDPRFKEIIYETFLNNIDLKKAMEDTLAAQVKLQFRQMLGMRD